MSLNKFTDGSVKKEWMNINCNDIKATTAEIDNLIINDPTFETLLVESNNIPQVVIKPETTTLTSYLELGPANIGTVAFKDNGSGFGGFIRSTESTDKFVIDPQDRNNVTVEAPLQLFKNTTINNPDANHVAIYAKDTDDNLYVKNSAGTENQIAIVGAVSSAVETVYSNANLNFVVGSLTYVNTLFYPSGIGTNIIPANTIEEGDIYELHINGVLRPLNLATVYQFASYHDGVTASPSVPTSIIPQGSNSGTFDVVYQIGFYDKDVSGPGTFKTTTTGKIMVQESTPQFLGMVDYSFGTIDYTTDTDIDIQVKMSNGDPDNGLIVYTARIIKIR